MRVYVYMCLCVYSCICVHEFQLFAFIQCGCMIHTHARAHKYCSTRVTQRTHMYAHIHKYTHTLLLCSYIPPPLEPSVTPSTQPTDEAPNTYTSTPNPLVTADVETTPAPIQFVAPGSVLWATGTIAGVTVGATVVVMLAALSVYFLIRRVRQARLAKGAEPFRNILAGQQSAGDATAAGRQEAQLESLELQGFSKVDTIANKPSTEPSKPEPAVGPVLGSGPMLYGSEPRNLPEAIARASSRSGAGVTDVSLVFEQVRGSGIVQPYVPAERPALMPEAAVTANLEYYEPSVSTIRPGMLRNIWNYDDDE